MPTKHVPGSRAPSTGKNNLNQGSPRLAKYTPPASDGVYARPDLFALLERLESRSKGVWISAPAGSGKTTLAASYLAQRETALLWYRLDEGDSDPASFFHHLREAVAASIADASETLPTLTAEYLAAVPVFARNFFRSMYALLPTPCAIVLDNHQEVSRESALHKLLTIAMEEAPEEVSFFILSREAPSTEYARMQANQTLAVLNSDSLTLSQEETAGIAALYRGSPVDESIVAQLHQRTRGWAAGLILMLQSGETVLEAPGNELTPEAIFDYFATQVLERVPPVLQQFLLQTAVLPAVEPELASELTGDPAAENHLAELQHRNFFVTLHPGTGRHYVFHPLFRDFLLRHGSKVLGEAGLRDLRCRAGVLLDKCGESDAAMDLLLEAGYWEEAEQVLQRTAPAMLQQGRYQRLIRWIERLPANEMAHRPWFHYWLGMARIPYNIPEGRDCLEQAYARFRQQKEPGGAYLSLAAILESYFFQWDDFAPVPGWMEEMEQLQQEFPLSRFPELEPRVMSGILAGLCFAYPDDHRLPPVAARLYELVQAAPLQPETLPMAVLLSMYYCWMGAHDRETEIVRNTSQFISSKKAAPLARLHARVSHAVYSWLVGDADEAIHQARAGLEEARESGVHLQDSMLAGQGIYAAVMSRQLDKAEAFAEQNQRVLHPDRRLDTAHFYYQSAYIAALRGDLDEALGYSHSTLEKTRSLSCGTAITLAEIQYAQLLGLRGRIEEAQVVLESPAEYARRTGSSLFGSQVAITRAGLMWLAGDMESLLACLPEALAVARENRQIGPHVLLHDFITPLCQLALAHEMEVDLVGRLIRCGNLMPVDMLPVPENWPFPVKIQAMGPFQVWHEGKRLDMGAKAQNKPLDLLKALIALGSEEVSTIRLAEALWPDADGDLAAQNLKTTLHRLRKLIGPESVTMHDGRASLNRRRCGLDLWRLEAELARTEAAATPEPELAHRLLELYQAPLLSDCELPIAIDIRERLRMRYLRILEGLAIRLLAAGDTDTAIACYEKGLEIEPLAEGYYQGLMRCYLELGRLAEGLAIYARCEETLARELRIAPSAETRALRQTLAAASPPTDA